MKSMLLDYRTTGGSRQFAELPESCSWDELHQHIKTLRGATMSGFVTDSVTEMWIDFTFKGHSFAINNQFGQFWFFTSEPRCPEDILTAIVEHCEVLLLQMPHTFR